jgi:hypothetical protein
MELKSCKMTYNRNNNIVTSSIFEILMDQVEGGEKLATKDLLAKLQDIIKTYCPLMEEFNTSDEE